MAVIGAISKKRFSDGFEYVNRYWISAPDLVTAASYAVLIANQESTLHSQECTILNVHFWVRGANPNQKVTVITNLQGLYNSPGMLRPQIVARLFFATPDTSNPMFKDFRPRVSSSELSNGLWGTTFQTAMTTYKNLVEQDGVPYCTSDEKLLGLVTPDSQYQFRQLSKRWYNRPTTP